MDITQILKYALGVDTAILIIVILLQNRSGGVGTVFGGSGGGEFYRSKRGLEKTLYYATMVLGLIFVILALAIAILSI